MNEIFKLYRELHGLLGENDLLEEFRQRIHCVIQEIIDRIPEGTRIAIRPAGKETKNLLASYDFTGKNIVGIVNRSSFGDDFCGYPCFTADTFSSKSCDVVIISAFRYRQEIKEELEALQVPYIDFHDELEKRGIRLDVSYYDYELYTQLVVNYFYLRFQRSEARTQQEIALNELLQVAVECKDFTLISNIYQACGGENGEFPLLKTVWEKSKQLLDCIQNKLQERKQKDIVLFWTDAVPYEMLCCLPKVMELSKQGILFHRAYTNTPYTSPVLRAMFRNLLPIDDFLQSQEKIDSENSSLLQFMENKGYKVRFVGDPTRAMGKEHLIEEHEGLSCNIKWWEGILDLLESPEPCFYLFHLFESHEPWYTPDLKEPVDPYTSGRAQQEAQAKASFGYLDRALMLYHQLLGNKTQVFFSDHGLHWWDDTRWPEHTLHAYCFVVGENIPKKAVTQFFPYRNFDKFVRWLVDPEHFSLEDACTDEVIFQDSDFYNPSPIARFLQTNNARKGLAYRGILNYDHKYVINSLGEEFFYRMQQDGSEEAVPLEDSALRTELKRKAGTKFLDIYQYDKFIHTRKLYEAINQEKRID